MPSRALHLYSRVLVIVTLALLLAGGLVTSTDSGLSVPDWPLSYGQWFPPMIGGIRFEHTHRMIAALVGVLTLVLTVWIYRKEKRKWLRQLGLISLGAVLAQALLGGITVLWLLPDAISIFHACLAQTFFCLVTAVSFFTSRAWFEGKTLESESSGAIRRMAVAATVLIYLQLVTGAVVRHASGTGVFLHILLAFGVLFHVAALTLRIAGDFSAKRALFKQTLWIAGLVLAQILLGFGSFFFTLVLPKAEWPRTAEVLFTAAHQTNGAVILASSFLLTLRAFRFLEEAAVDKAEPVSVYPFPEKTM